MEKSDAGFLVVSFLAVGFVFGAAFFHLTEKPWVYDYQSLIASGFAIAAAAVTLGAMRTQIAEQRNQLSEQKKQTDFLLGNALPTIDAIRHIRIPQVAVIRVVNWNRRPIILHKLRMDHADHTHRIRRVIVWDRDNPKARWVKRQLVGDTLDPPIPMHGWKNRSGAPCEVRIDVVGVQGRRLSSDWDGSSVAVELVIAGEDGQDIKLNCPISKVG